MTEITCSACLLPEDEWRGSAKGPCGHSMCMPCFMAWIRIGRPNCPLCRGNFVSEEENRVQTYEEEQARILEGQRYEAAMRQITYQERLTRHLERVMASRERRTVFLHQTQDEFRVHCVTCTDENCRATHMRRMRWLERGKLVACPNKLSSLPQSTLGLLTQKKGIAGHKKFLLYTESTRLGEELRSRRINGFKEALRHQESVATQLKESRALTKGSVVSRTGQSLRDFVQAPMQSPGIKTFKGFTPPKRGARVGDLWESGSKQGICTGYNLWTLSDGTKTHLDKATNKWI